MKSIFENRSTHSRWLTCLGAALALAWSVGCNEAPSSSPSGSPSPSASSDTAAAPEPLVIKHSQGETTLQGTPKRVVAFDVASLDTLDTLKVDVTAVAGTVFPDYLSKYKADTYKNVGTLFEPNYEAVAALKPDLIISGGRSRSKYPELQKLAPTIDLSPDQKDFINEVTKNTQLIGKIFGKEKEAESEIQKLNTVIEAVKAKASSFGKVLIIITTGGKISAYGPGSRYGFVHDTLGLAPAEKNLDTSRHGESISSEFILEKNPDWLFVIDRDAALETAQGAAQKLLDNELMHKTSAWKNKQVLYLNPAQWYLIGGGITSVQRMVGELNNALPKSSGAESPEGVESPSPSAAPAR